MNLLFLRSAKDSFQRVAFGAPLDRSADFDISVAWVVFVLAVLDCRSTSADCPATRSDARSPASGRAGALGAGQAVASIRAGLRLRDSVVSGHLLLGVRHDASLRRPADSGCPAGSACGLHVYGAVSRPV